MPALYRGERHDTQPGAVGDHADHAIEAFRADPHLHAPAQVQRLFFQVQGQRTGGAEADIAVLQRAGEVGLVTVCERVIGGHDQHQWIIAKGAGLQVGGGHCGGDDAEVGAALAQRLNDAQARQFLDVHIDVRALAQKAGEQFRQVLGQRRRVAQQAHLAVQAAGVLGQIELQPLDLLADLPRVGDQRLARRRGLHAAAVAFEQGDAQRAFHGADPRTGCRQGKVAALRPGGDVAALDGVEKKPKVDKVEVHVPLPGECARSIGQIRQPIAGREADCNNCAFSACTSERRLPP